MSSSSSSSPSHSFPSPLVSPEWLSANLSSSSSAPFRIRCIDCSWYLPDANRDGYSEYQLSHIISSIYFPIDEICDKSLLPLLHMIPPLHIFSLYLSQNNIRSSDRLILYDNSGAFCASTRVWWTFRFFGFPAEQISILHCSYHDFKEKYPSLCTNQSTSIPTNIDNNNDIFQCNPRVSLLTSAGELLWYYSYFRKEDGSIEFPPSLILLDGREKERWECMMIEPRSVKRLGRLPASKSVYHASIQTIKMNGKQSFLPIEQIKTIFESVGVNFSLSTKEEKQKIICLCGSGVTASTLVFALYLCGIDDASLYDGSFAEWGNSKDWPIEAETTAEAIVKK